MEKRKTNGFSLTKGGIGGEYLTERVSLCFVNKPIQNFLLRYLNNKGKFHQIREICKLAKTF